MWVERVTAGLYLLLGVPNVLLQTKYGDGLKRCIQPPLSRRMWLHVASGATVTHGAMPLLAVKTLCDNGALLRLLRHNWCVAVLPADPRH